ncbi:FixH family protein [soil metagenome]
MSETSSPAGQFTGRHMLAAIVTFFAIIIAANVTMAVFAGTSWTGLVVPNSYIASQEFNQKAAEARAQDALGWSARLHIKDGRLEVALLDATGQNLHAATKGSITFRRPAYESEDQKVMLTALPDGALGGPQALRDGIWIAEIMIDAGLNRPYREFRRIVVQNGSLQ